MTTNPSHAITLHKVSMVYKQKIALKSINLTLDRGKIYGLIGRNGAGKTTLIKLINGDEIPSLGKITISPGLRIGHVSIDNHFPDNLEVMDIDKLFSASDQTWLSERFWHLMEQFNLTEKQKYGELSTGEKAGVRLSVLFARKPDIWLIDEATQGLDALAQKFILESFLEYFTEDNPCCVFCSHNLYEIERLADYLLVQKDSEIIWQGDTQELITQEKNFSEKVIELFGQINEEIVP